MYCSSSYSNRGDIKYIYDSPDSGTSFKTYFTKSRTGCENPYGNIVTRISGDIQQVTDLITQANQAKSNLSGVILRPLPGDKNYPNGDRTYRLSS